MLDAFDPITAPPHRVLVAGVTGVGKSTLAKLLARRLNLPYTEIDSLYHGPNWTPRPSFLTDIAALSATEYWITEWQYASARTQLAARAELLVWLDYPVRVFLFRLIRRSVWRRLTHQKLWSGNTEAPLWHLVTGKDGVIAWALSSSRKYPKLMADLEWTTPQLTIVRIRSQRELDSWLGRLSVQQA
jgi:energy-coupling factor transporter ATP-binding protein EcfA2